MSEQKQNDEWKERELGALWLKESSNGSTKFLSGKIGDQEVVAYRNKQYEEGGNKPLYHVYKSKPLGDKKEAKPANEPPF